MSLTRFTDRVSGVDGPVSGAFTPLVVPLQGMLLTGAVTNAVYTGAVQMPTGAKYQVTHATVYCGTVASDPSITIGTSAAGTQIVAAANLASGANQLTVKTYTAAATGLISIVLTNDTGDSITDPTTVTLWGYLAQPPTSLKYR